MAAHVVVAEAPVVVAKAQKEAKSSRTSAANVYAYPFEPAATTHEKMSKQFFLESVLATSDPRILLKDFLSGVRLLRDPYHVTEIG